MHNDIQPRTSKLLREEYRAEIPVDKVAEFTLLFSGGSA
jgi:hypothetical protein